MNNFNLHIGKLIRNLRNLQYSRPHKKDRKRTCTLLHGNLFSAKLFDSFQEIYSAANIPLTFERILLPGDFHKTEPLDRICQSILRNRFCLLGLDISQHQNLLSQLREALGLYVSAVHVKNLPSVKTAQSDVDYILFSNLADGEFSVREYQLDQNIVICMKTTTEENWKRIEHLAFNYATRKSRKNVTAVHKGNIFKVRDGMFLKCGQKISKLYPYVNFASVIVDNCAMQLVSRPGDYEVIILPNLYNYAINGIAAASVGGPEMLTGTFFFKHGAIFGPASTFLYPDPESFKFSPYTLLLSSSNLLDHVNRQEHAQLIWNALAKVSKDQKLNHADLKSETDYLEFFKFVTKNLVQSKCV